MKIIFWSLFLWLFVFAAVTSTAKVRFGLKTGFNSSTMTLKTSGLSIEPYAVLGIHAGVLSEIPLNGQLFLQPGVFFSLKGSGYYVDGYDTTILPGFLEFPVNLLYKIDLKPFKVLMFGGPYFAFGVSGYYSSVTESKDIIYGSGSDCDMRPFDFGLNLGSGFEFHRFQLTGQYGFGLKNLAPMTTPKSEMKSRLFEVSLAYLFGKS